MSVDDILAEAGVARMTLYKNFDSKEELIVATLQLEDKMFRQWLAASWRRGRCGPLIELEACLLDCMSDFQRRVTTVVPSSGRVLNSRM